MYIALCLVVNIKCIVCVFKGGGSQWIANQSMVRILFKCSVLCGSGFLPLLWGDIQDFVTILETFRQISIVGSDKPSKFAT